MHHHPHTKTAQFSVYTQGLCGDGSGHNLFPPWWQKKPNRNTQKAIQRKGWPELTGIPWWRNRVGYVCGVALPREIILTQQERFQTNLERYASLHSLMRIHFQVFFFEGSGWGKVGFLLEADH